MKYAALSHLLVLLFASGPAFAWDPLGIEPISPTANQPVSVVMATGGCDALPSTDGFPQISQTDQDIRILFYGVRATDPEFCVYPNGQHAYPVGHYPAGNYSLRIDVVYENFPFGLETVTLATIPFSVSGSPAATPVAAPALNGTSLALLATLIAAVAAMTFRRRLSALLLALLCFSPIPGRADTGPVIELLVKNTAGAPTASQIINYYNTPAGQRLSPPPLPSLDSLSPQSTSYLIPVRATGDFLAWLNNNPHSIRTALENKLLVSLLQGANVAAALATLRADPLVHSADEPVPRAMSSASLIQFNVIGSAPADEGVQYGWFDMNVDKAWQRAGGYALVGVIDTGLEEAHPALRQFDGNYVGGNFIKSRSLDVSQTGPLLTNVDNPSVDEARAVPISDPSCNVDPQHHPNLPPVQVGHGTHVSGLIAANSTVGLGVVGTCKHCGIAMWKTNRAACNPASGEVALFPNNAAEDRALAQLTDIGSQIVNMSFGGSLNYSYTFCDSHPAIAMCMGIIYAGDARDVLMAASSGNDRKDVNFPALDYRVVSVGGSTSSQSFWDEFPACPVIPNTDPGIECGSNYSKLSSGQYKTHQELVAAAKSIFSTFYTNRNWGGAYAQCGDSYPGPNGNGVGTCTGTSMSAPQVAGIFGILRSINPLIRVSVPQPTTQPVGLRTVIARTASRASLGWDNKYGYGIPNASEAVKQLLGNVDGVIAVNRATPLFRLRDLSTKDYAETTSPQTVLSLMINQVHKYVLIGSMPADTVPGGYVFPSDPNTGTGDDFYDTTLPPTPVAKMYVLTTEYRPRSGYPALRPLYLMDKVASGGFDYLLATTKAEVEGAAAQQYDLLTIQGYIYEPCTPEPACIPIGAKPLWREYRSTDNDCAVFLDAERSTFEGLGYTGVCPGGTAAAKKIGYAYPGGDADNDGLPDALEYVIGTDPARPDSDSDGLSDSTEYPLAGVPVSDPCSGPGARYCPADLIFKFGFEHP